jgi:hypothetical protein
MTIGTSMFLIAIGAILKYAITESVAGINVQTAGVILIVVGAAGLLFTVVTAGRDRWATAPPRG